MAIARKVLQGAMVVAVSGLAVTLGQAEAYAYPVCGPKGSNHVTYSTDGWYGPQPIGIAGSSSYIVTRLADQCASDRGPSTFVTAYNMVYSAGNHGWAQAGIYQGGNGTCVKGWVQQKLNSEQNKNNFTTSCLTSGSAHAYRNLMVVPNPGDGYFHVRSSVDGVDLMTSAFRPATDWQTPFQIEFSGETFFAESDVPGNVSARTDLYSMGVQRQSDFSTVTTCNNANMVSGSYGRGGSRYAADSIACDHVRVWTP